MTAETHVFILWHRGSSAYQVILDEIVASLEILKVFQLQWTPARFANNLTRFYGQKLPRGCEKQLDCGMGPFFLFVVSDPAPCYEMRRTTKGGALVNVHSFDLKTRLRSPVGGNLPVHASDTAQEAAHNLNLLLGPEQADLLLPQSAPWDRQIIRIHRDISGAHGWRDLAEMFAVANATIDYVVMRNFEFLPERHEVGSHGDIDLLVNSLQDARLVLNAVPTTAEPKRVQHMILVGGKSVPIDLRFIGDGYYDASWENDLLASRRLTKTGVFVPDGCSHFYSLLYHAAVHKPEISPDYVRQLCRLAEEIGIKLHLDQFDDSGFIRDLLLHYMRSHGYRFTRPADESVYFNLGVAEGKVWQYLRSIFGPAIQDSTKQMLSPLPSALCQSISPVGNLLRPFLLKSKLDVLELGCGSGELTIFLADALASVVAVEGDPECYSQALERCKNCSSIEVIAENPLQYSTNRRFDLVIFLNFHEYTSRQHPSEDPVTVCLEQARSFLKPDGVLVVATENQLGLKYFNGCAEHHLGAPYYGLHGLYREDEPKAMGRAALEKKLAAAGLPHHQFYYPFPDYKLPQVILADAALSTPSFDAAALLAGIASRNAEGDFNPNFHENLAWRTITENGLLPHLANSFLVLAAAKEDAFSKFKTDWLACAYTTSRMPTYATETLFSGTSSAILVEKRRLHSVHPVPKINLTVGNLLHQVGTVCDYIVGRPYLLELQQRLGRGEGVSGVVEWAAPWLDLLLSNSGESGAGMILPGDWVDAIPQNFIRDADGRLRRIDKEWTSDGTVPLAWVVIRGLVTALGVSPISDGLHGLNVKDLITRIAVSNGIDLAEADFNLFQKNESELRAVVYGCDNGESWQQSASALGQYPACHLIPDLKRDHHDNVVAELTGEITRIKSTVSWQITKPLRLLAYLIRQVHGALGKRR